MIWFILWLRYTQDSPAEDPELSEEEKSHIEKTIDNDYHAKKSELRKVMTQFITSSVHYKYARAITSRPTDILLK